jgi:hypothetical protein
MIIIFFNEFDLKFFQLCDNSNLINFSKIHLIHTLCDKDIFTSCVIGKSCCVIQVITHFKTANGLI